MISTAKPGVRTNRSHSRADREARLAAALREGARWATRYRLVVPREAMRGAVGTRAGSQSGASLDFRDYRDYSPGDDLRHIDWNVVARTERYIVKLFREEVVPHLDLTLDVSQSMDLPGSDKAAAALRLAALLSAAAAQASCACKVWLAGSLCEPAPDSGVRGAALRRPPAFEAIESPAPGIAAAAGGMKRNGLRVLISDLLWEEDPMRALWPLADRAAALHVIQLLTVAERDPGETGHLRIQDVESGFTRDVFAESATLERYRTGLRSHENAWREGCRRCGARFMTLTAETLDEQDALKPLQRHGLIE